MRIAFLALSLLLGSSAALAGPVKIKDGIVSIDEKPVFQYEGAMRIEGATAMVHSAVSKAPLFTVHFVGADGMFHFNVKFTGIEGEARRYTAISFKALFQQIHASGAVTPEGAIDLEKAAEFHRMHGRPIPTELFLVIF